HGPLQGVDPCAQLGALGIDATRELGALSVEPRVHPGLEAIEAMVQACKALLDPAREVIEAFIGPRLASSRHDLRLAPTLSRVARRMCQRRATAVAGHPRGPPTHRTAALR